MSNAFEIDGDSSDIIGTCALRFAKMSANAKTPTRGSKFAAGYDLYSAYDYTLPPKGKQLCETVGQSMSNYLN